MRFKQTNRRGSVLVLVALMLGVLMTVTAIAAIGDPDAFVDLVEAVHRKPEDARFQAAVALQRLEWRLLFDYCMRRATGQ